MKCYEWSLYRAIVLVLPEEWTIEGTAATTAAAHANGAIVQLHQKGAPNSKAHLKEAVLVGTKTTLTGRMTDDSITSLHLDLLARRE